MVVVCTHGGAAVRAAAPCVWADRLPVASRLHNVERPRYGAEADRCATAGAPEYARDPAHDAASTPGMHRHVALLALSTVPHLSVRMRSATTLGLLLPPWTI